MAIRCVRGFGERFARFLLSHSFSDVIVENIRVRKRIEKQNIVIDTKELYRSLILLRLLISHRRK